VGIKLFLDRGGIGTLRGNPSAMSVPVLQQHGDGGRPAAIFGLSYEWYVQPDSGFFLGPRSSRRSQEKKQEQTENDPAYANNERLQIKKTTGVRPPGQ
jgi:hypothetical protein